MSRELRIFGPPGTGKTTHLKQRVEAYIDRGGSSSGIRIASLTRAAALEIAGRVELPKGAVGTLHSHAYRALEQPSLAESNDGIGSWNREKASKLGAAFELHNKRVNLDDVAGEQMAPGGTEAEGLLQTYSTLRARCAPRELWPPVVAAFATHWEEWKKRTGRLDFNDLIEVAARDVPAMPGTPSVFLLDEAQDMSRLDMLLARRWGEACKTFVVVGDPDQNLYGFRGAEPEAFTGVELDDDRVHVLDRSYRVPTAVLDYAMRWLRDELPTRSGAVYRPRLLDTGEEAPGVVRRAEHTLNAPEAPGGEDTTAPSLVDELEGHLAAGRRVMVLASCGFHLEPLIAALRARGVPFGNPYRTNDGRLNPLVGAQRVVDYLAGMPVEFGGEGRDWTWNEVRRWAEPLKAQGVFDRGSKSYIEAKCTAGPGTRFADVRPGDELAPYDAVMDLLTDEARLHLGLGDLDYYAEHLLGSKAGPLAYGLKIARDRGPDALRAAPKSSGPGLIVGTVHSVKGGEAEVVYVFPDLSRPGFANWLTPGPTRDAVARLFYVAFTRARDELVICASSSLGNTVTFPNPESEDA